MDMTLENVFNIFNQSTKAISLYRAFEKDLKKICPSKRLPAGLKNEMKWEENYIKKGLFKFDDKDRAEIISYAFENIANLEREKDQITEKTYNEELAATTTLIDINNEVTFTKCYYMPSEKVQEQLSFLPQNQHMSFSSYLGEMVEHFSEENCEEIDVLKSLHESVERTYKNLYGSEVDEQVE